MIWSEEVEWSNGVVRECDYDQVKKVISEEIGGGKNKKFIIYPYGKFGKIAKEILDELGEKSYVIIDENLADESKGIYKLSILREKEYSTYTILLCSNSLQYYNILRETLSNYVDKNRIVDVCIQDSLFSMLQFKEPRLSALECAAREIYVNKIEGNVAEAGVFQGNFAKYINKFFPDKKLYLIDTFDGFDERDVKVDVENSFSKGNQDWSDTNIQLVLRKMKYSENCIVKKGYFPDVMGDMKEQFCFVSLDMDLYQPIYAGLYYFYPRLSHGGYIFVHDCRNLGYMGARKAVMNFCKEMNIGYVPLQDYWGSVVITK